MTASLAGIADAVGIAAPSADATIVDLTHDSRAVGPGWLFCCVRGANVDGHHYAAAAVEAGAVALLAERPVTDAVPTLIVDDVRAAMGPAASVVHEHPSQRLAVVGVTGTNGKSSIVQLFDDIWAAAGIKGETYGTLSGPRTTPEAPDLQRKLAASRAADVEAVAMEVSSHALSMGRVAGTSFAATVFTNLGRDHLDFHHDMEAYFEAKATLFSAAYTGRAVVNRDDPYGVRLIDRLADTDIDVVTYGLADATGLVVDGPRSRFNWRGQPIELPLAGRHSVSNALAAASAAAALGIHLEHIAAGLAATRPVRGRFELVDGGQPFAIAVDYAHTPDALEVALAAARDVASGRVIAVFGCGGDRDVDKRPEMGHVVDVGADIAVVTSDNPRSEDPDAIIAAITAGMGASLDGEPNADTIVEPDRAKAIALALDLARPGDLVLIAGKGHETTQTIGATERPFDDRAVALDALGANA